MSISYKCCIVDVDECTTGNGGCADICTNSAGGYSCSCSFGYELNADTKTCDG